MSTFRDWLKLRWLSGTMAIFLVFLMLTLLAMYGVVQIGAMEDRLLATEHEVFPEAGRAKAGAGFVYCGGKQFFGQNTTAANWCFENVHANASTPTVLYTFPAVAANEQHTYGVTVEERCDEADAAVSLDGGTCAATVRRYVTGELVGGAFCTSQGVCATGASTAIDVSVDPTQFAPGGVLATCIPTIVWNGTALEVLAPSCPVGTYNSGWATGLHSKDIADGGVMDSGPADASDSGADAADAADASDSGTDGGTDSGLDASDAADAGDAGPPCTITSVSPDWAFASGSPSNAITIIGANFGTSATVTIGSVAATFASSTTGTCTGQTSGNCLVGTAPACTGSTSPTCTVANGTASAPILQVTSSATGYGVCSTTASTAPDIFWYVPTGGTSSNVIGGWAVLPGTTTTLTDQGPNGYTLTEVATTPTFHASGGGRSGALPYLTTSTYGQMCTSSYAGGASNVTWAVTATPTGTPANAQMIVGNDFSTDSLIFASSLLLNQYNGSTGNGVTLTASTWSSLLAIFTGSTTSSIALNGGTPVTGTSPGAGSAAPEICVLGGSGGQDHYLGNFSLAVEYSVALGATPAANLTAFLVTQ